MPKTKEKTEKVQKKGKGKKVCLIIVIVLVVLAIVSAVFIELTTKPVDENADNFRPVGGMVTSENIDYKSDTTQGLEKNAVIKIMQMVWRFIADGDESRIERQTPPENIKEFDDIYYIDDGNVYHKLDVYYPENTPEGTKLPVIIDIHGGGWIYGDKGINKYYCMELAKNGYVVFNMSYRLVPDVTVNEQLQDVFMALDWIKKNMANYPCDENNVFLTGDSAGGQLCGYATVLLNSPELRETFDVVDPQLKINASLMTSPVAYMRDCGPLNLYTAVCWGSDYKSKPTADYMDFDKLLDEVESTDLPPIYLVTSSGDMMAHGQTNRAAKDLEDRGFVYQLDDYGKELDGKSQPHVFAVIEPFEEAGQKCIENEIAFFKANTK